VRPVKVAGLRTATAPGGERVVPGAYWGGGRFEPQLPELAIPGRFWRHNMKNLWGSSTNLNQVFLQRVLVDNPLKKKVHQLEAVSVGKPCLSGATHFEKHLGKGEVAPTWIRGILCQIWSWIRHILVL